MHHVAAPYSRAAVDYGRVGTPLFAPAGQRLVELADVSAGQCVVDVAASGTRRCSASTGCSGENVHRPIADRQLCWGELRAHPSDAFAAKSLQLVSCHGLGSD